MPAFSLFQPLPGLPWPLLLIWPLIFWRIQRLRAWFRANGRPGSQMLWGITRSGRVVVNLLSDDLSGRRPSTASPSFSPPIRVPGACRGLLQQEIPAFARNADSITCRAPTHDPASLETDLVTPGRRRLSGRLCCVQEKGPNLTAGPLQISPARRRRLSQRCRLRRRIARSRSRHSLRSPNRARCFRRWIWRTVCGSCRQRLRPGSWRP